MKASVRYRHHPNLLLFRKVSHIFFPAEPMVLHAIHTLGGMVPYRSFLASFPFSVDSDELTAMGLDEVKDHNEMSRKGKGMYIQ